MARHILLFLFLLTTLFSCFSPSNKQLIKVIDQPEEFRLLLEKVNNVDRKNKNKMTLLHYAAWVGYPEAAKILLERGADPLIIDGGYRNALDYAVISRNLEILGYIFDYYPELSVYSEEREKNLLLALESFQSEVLALFLKNGLSPNQRLSKGSTLLAYAASYDQDNKAVIDLLLQAGADPNSIEKDGKTPLFFFTMGTSSELYQTLYEAGTDFNHLDDFGHSAAYYSSLNGFPSQVIWMMQRGHIPNENYYVLDRWERNYTVTSREWVHYAGTPRLQGQTLVREDVTTSHSVTDEELVPLLEYVEKSDYPDLAETLRDLGYRHRAEKQ